MKKNGTDWAWALVLVLAVAGLYGQFLSSALIFDDLQFFLLDRQGAQPVDTATFAWLGLRTLPYATLAWTKAAFGLELVYFRLGNLALHAVTVVTLYFFLQRVLARVYVAKSADSLTAQQAAFLGALVFALHPVATYAAGYLIQRTILMATLFGLLALLCYVQGSLHGRRWQLWLSFPLFYLAAYSKEHAITLILVPPALAMLLHEDWRASLRGQWALLTAWLCVVALVVFAKRGILGTVYEIDAPLMLSTNDGDYVYARSVITQCGLFFKYVWLWLLPNITQMSIDMREPFVRSVASLQLAWVALFVAWGALGVWLLRQRGNRGLLGFAMLFPWLMFMTELASVRIQEPFVLYRSYLWMGAALLALPVALNGMAKKQVALVALVILATSTLLSMERLITLSDPTLLWADAKDRLHGRTDLQGADRIYYNLSRHQLDNGMLGESEENAKTAVAIAPEFAQAHALLGAVYKARGKWELSIEQYTLGRNIDIHSGKPPQSVYLMGRAKAYEGNGQLELAVADYLEACRIDIYVCDQLRKSATVKKTP